MLNQSCQQGFKPAESISDTEETEELIKDSVISGVVALALFAEPFRIRVVFSDGSSQEFVVSEQDLIFFQSQLGPDDSLIILEDIGIRTLEQRILRNEQNLVLIGQDTTQLGLDTTILGDIAVRQDSSIQELQSANTAQWNSIGDLWTSQDEQWTAIGENASRIGTGGGGFFDFLGPLFGGIGIGSIIVLVIIGILVFRKGI